MRYSRRLFTLMLLTAALAASGLAPAAAVAQDATPPAAMFPDTMGLPELPVTVTDTAFEGLPAETPAGRYLVTLEITAADGGGLSFMQLPEGMSVDDFIAMLAGPPAASPEAAMGTPMADAGPPEGEQGPPEWYYQTKMAGGTFGDSGQTSQVIVDLTPGEWIAWADDPASPQPPVALTVTGDPGTTPAAAAEPEASATISMFEYGFEIEGEFTTGPQAIKVTNIGAQPHFAYMFSFPEPVTKEQIGQILELEMQGATPAPDSGLPNPDEFIPVAFAGTISNGVSEWIPVDLQPGQYGLVCFVPDLASGLPHAYDGMYDIFEVGGA